MSALDRLRQKLGDSKQPGFVSFVSPSPYQSEESQTSPRARAHAPREEKVTLTNYMNRNDISSQSPDSRCSEFPIFVEEATAKTDKNPEGAATAAMWRDAATVVQDLLAEGKEIGHVRRLFGLSWDEIRRLKQKRASEGEML